MKHSTPGDIFENGEGYEEVDGAGDEAFWTGNSRSVLEGSSDLSFSVFGSDAAEDGKAASIDLARRALKNVK